MVPFATERKLAWLVLAILVCVAFISFEQGLKSALAGPRPALPGETAAALAVPGAAPRDASAPTPLDEARVHEIAREEADAAVTRAKPVPHKVRVAPVEDPADTGDANAAPDAPAATGPATPQDPPSTPDRQGF